MPQCGSCDIKIQSLLNTTNHTLNSSYELSLLVVAIIYLHSGRSCIKPH